MVLLKLGRERVEWERQCGRSPTGGVKGRLEWGEYCGEERKEKVYSVREVGRSQRQESGATGESVASFRSADTAVTAELY